jgi:hypothetical protein
MRFVSASDRALNDLAIKLTVDPTDRAKALAAWWARWERLPELVRDRPAADVLAEPRSLD